jgi:hypothetical protein
MNRTTGITQEQVPGAEIRASIYLNLTLLKPQEYLVERPSEKLRPNWADTPMARQKIALACQGGGSQTAFTAGVLSTFFERGLHLQKQIVSLSGTSGGAVCAGLAWYGLLKAASGDPTPIQKRIKDFWEEIIAQLAPELFVDKLGAEMLRMIADGSIPHLELSPVSALNQMLFSAVEFFNGLLREGAINFDIAERWGFMRRAPITVRTIHMSPELQSTLDYVSKLSREPSQIHSLIEDGEKQGRKFLESLASATPAP